MGFLDHSTNNIIVDAVLTDTGRRLLSRNDGTFNIAKFALGDDEVDYSIIKKFGVTVGKEKIEKNTPVFEAFTKHNIGLKHKLISISDPYLDRLPQYTLLNSTADLISLNRSSLAGANNRKLLNFELKTSNNVSIPEDATDFVVEVCVDRNFLTLSNASADYVRENIAYYRLSTSGESGGSLSLSFQLETVDSIDDELFSSYSLFDGRLIETYVTIKGLNTGINKTITVQITK